MKEKIKLSTWIVICVAIIFVWGYVIFWMSNNLRWKDNPQQQISSSSTQSVEISDLQQQITDLKNRPPEVKTETVIKEVPQPIAKSNDTDYSSIIAEWQNRVARVECTWSYPNGKTIQTGQGSGTLVNVTDIGLALVTNQHVVLGDDNGPDNLVLTTRAKHSAIHSTKYDPICSVDGCSGKHLQHSYCQKHFWQIRRHNKITN